MTPVLLYSFRREQKGDFIWSHQKLRCYSIHPDGSFRYEVLLKEVYISSESHLEAAVAQIRLTVSLSEDVRWFVYDCGDEVVLRELSAEFIAESRVSVSY